MALNQGGRETSSLPLLKTHIYWYGLGEQRQHPMLLSMDVPNPSTSNPNPTQSPTTFSQNASNNPSPTTSPYPFFISPNNTTASPFKGSHHRRAQSEVIFHNADDIGDPFDASAAFMEEIGFDDDPFSTYIDVNMIGNTGDINGSADGEKTAGSNSYGSGGGDGGEEENGKNNNKPLHHRHCNSMGELEIVEPKKAMPSNKLAELWVSDPKRAKRILANRQSAARSKERKARYITELEKKVETLQKEANSLATQLSMYQRDATDLTAENAELKLRLQTMEHQAQMRDVLNEALMQEVDRLKLATGEIMTTTADSLKLVGVQHNTSQVPARPQNVQLLPLFHTAPSTMSPRPIYDHLRNCPLGCIQGLDINNTGYLVKVENSPLANENGNPQWPENFSSRGYLVKGESPPISASGTESSTATY